MLFLLSQIHKLPRSHEVGKLPYYYWETNIIRYTIPQIYEIVATVNNQKTKFAFSRKDEPASNSGNHVIFVLVSVLGTNLLLRPCVIVSPYKATVLCYTWKYILPFGAEPLANAPSSSQPAIDRFCSHWLQVVFTVREFSSYCNSTTIGKGPTSRQTNLHIR